MTTSALLLGGFLLLLLVVPPVTESKPSANPFKFFGNLTGSKRGQKVDGLNKIKSYLARLGYFQDSPINHDYYGKINVSEQDDQFDERLESAIKTYQLNYGLKVTGYLDAATIEQMMRPRCGVPDIINGTTSMRSGQKKQQHGSRKSMYGVSFYAFTGPKWPPTEYDLTYKLLSNGLVPTNLDASSILSSAFSKWAQVSQFTFEEVNENVDSNIVAGFFRGEHGDSYPFDGPGGVLGHSFAPTNGRTHYDADENWSDNPGPTQIDLESVMLHELGHVLGLAHTSDPNAVMYPSIAPGVEKRDLQDDDIQGIQALYGQN
ncbi:hypothetical protein Ancab_015170 [Ancistrocladus abbreviatus]